MVIDPFKRLVEEKKRLEYEVRERTLSYIVAAFGLIAGLAWNDAVKSLIEYVFPLSGNTLLAKFLYAALITLAVVFITVYLGRILLREKEDSSA